MQHLKTLNEIYLYEDIAKQIHAYSASSLGSYLSHLIVLRNKFYCELNEVKLSKQEKEKLTLIETSKYITHCENILNKKIPTTQYAHMLWSMVLAYKNTNPKDKKDILYAQISSILDKQVSNLKKQENIAASYRLKQINLIKRELREITTSKEAVL